MLEARKRVMWLGRRGETVRRARTVNVNVNVSVSVGVSVDASCKCKCKCKRNGRYQRACADSDDGGDSGP